MTSTTVSRSERLYSLDAARAIAALAVVFQHWEHFFALAPFAAPPSEAPLFSVFQPLYEKGARAVTFFFCLSGFIFYWLYAQRIRERAVGPATFALLRLSRLYPLHLLTLLACLALQWPLMEMLGGPFIYPERDAKHFVLNLFLVQYWGFEDGFSFNGPSWSISVELFLYVAFFLACRFVRPLIWQCLALAVVGVLLARFSALAGAAASFFLGGTAYFVYRALAPRWTPLRNLILAAAVIALWILLPMALQPGMLAAPFGDNSVGRLVDAAAAALAERQYELILFPLTVLTCALSEAAWSRVPWRWLHDLGNMSFGIYLLHFPLQLVFVLIALNFAFPADFFRQPATLALFFLALIALAALSYRCFEKPAMLALRRMWKPPRATPEAQAVPAPAAPP